jgi:hypothetical protein
LDFQTQGISAADALMETGEERRCGIIRFFSIYPEDGVW